MDAPVAAETTSPPPHVAETMRRIQAELRSGAVPSYESLLVFGAPSIR